MLRTEMAGALWASVTCGRVVANSTWRSVYFHRRKPRRIKLRGFRHEIQNLQILERAADDFQRQRIELAVERHHADLDGVGLVDYLFAQLHGRRDRFHRL